jgi:hypothetical protein
MGFVDENDELSKKVLESCFRFVLVIVVQTSVDAL